MKKLRFAILLSFLGFLSSCGGITDPLPTNTTVTIAIPSSAPTKAVVGEKVTFNVEITAPANLSVLEVRRGSTRHDAVTSFTSNRFVYSFSYTPTIQDVGQTITFRFIATDAQSNVKNEDYNLAVEASLNNNNDIKLLHQNAMVLSSPGSFYSSVDNVIASSANAVVSKVDITYGIVGSNPSFVSPSARVANGLAVGSQTGWTRTVFAPSTLNFDTVTAANILQAATPTNEVQTATVNGVYLFQNAAGKRGIIRVKRFDTNGAGQDVVFDIKVIK